MFEISACRRATVFGAAAQQLLGLGFGVVDFMLRPVGGAMHAAWAMKGSLAYLHQLVSA
jgi:hypothetical protein